MSREKKRAAIYISPQMPKAQKARCIFMSFRLNMGKAQRNFLSYFIHFWQKQQFYGNLFYNCQEVNYERKI